MNQAIGRSGQDVCQEALSGIEARFGAVIELRAWRAPTTLAGDVDAISRPDLREAMLQAIDARVRTLERCAGGDFTGAAAVAETATAFDLAVGRLLTTTTR